MTDNDVRPPYPAITLEPNDEGNEIHELGQVKFSILIDFLSTDAQHELNFFLRSSQA